MVSVLIARQDPGESLDWTIDWSDWLDSDTIISSDWAVTGATKASDTNDDTATAIWVRSVTDGARAVNTIVTANGRTKDRAILFVREESSG